MVLDFIENGIGNMSILFVSSFIASEVIGTCIAVLIHSEKPILCARSVWPVSQCILAVVG